MSARALAVGTGAAVPLGQFRMARGPGRLGKEGAPGVVLWSAGSGILDTDLFGCFWDYEFGQMTWLDGFLCDPATTAWFEVLANPPEEDDLPEELYSRASMNTLGSDVVDDGP